MVLLRIVQKYSNNNNNNGKRLKQVNKEVITSILSIILLNIIDNSHRRNRIQNNPLTL